MFDYGTALELASQKAEAALVFRDGLNTPKKGQCNGFWHQQIKGRLSQMSPDTLESSDIMSAGYQSPLEKGANR